jgi:hypothetical protein
LASPSISGANCPAPSSRITRGPSLRASASLNAKLASMRTLMPGVSSQWSRAASLRPRVTR